jgi:hypothetical protein
MRFLCGIFFLCIYSYLALGLDELILDEFGEGFFIQPSPNSSSINSSRSRRYAYGYGDGDGYDLNYGHSESSFDKRQLLHGSEKFYKILKKILEDPRYFLK